MIKAFLYPKALANIFGGLAGGDTNQTDYLSQDMRMAFLTSAYTPSDTDEVWGDVSGDEISVTNYTAGGVLFTSKSISYSSTNRLIKVLGAPAYWHSDTTGHVDSGVDCRYAVVYNDTNDMLFGYIDLGSVITGNNATTGEYFGALQNADGLFNFSSRDVGSASWYGRAMIHALGGPSSGDDNRTDFISDSIKMALLTNAYTPDLNNDDIWADISANEASGSGYSAGGVALSTNALSLSGKVLSFSAADVTFTAVTLSSARYAAIYNDTPAGKPLLWLIDLGADQAPSAENLVIAWGGQSIAQLTCA